MSKYRHTWHGYTISTSPPFRVTAEEKRGLRKDGLKIEEDVEARGSERLKGKIPPPTDGGLSSPSPSPEEREDGGAGSSESTADSEDAC